MEDENQNWSFKIRASKTYAYPDDFLNKLREAMTLTAFQLFELDREIGGKYAFYVNEFIENQTNFEEE